MVDQYSKRSMELMKGYLIVLLYNIFFIVRAEFECIYTKQLQNRRFDIFSGLIIRTGHDRLE